MNAPRRCPATRLALSIGSITPIAILNIPIDARFIGLFYNCSSFGDSSRAVIARAAVARNLNAVRLEAASKLSYGQQTGSEEH